MTSAPTSYLQTVLLSRLAKAWTRSGSRENLVVLTDAELVVASVPKSQHSDLLARLDLGESADIPGGK